ncbi:MAG: zinc ribbon domain-containing protein [Thermotaleaceae bacterium]
MKDNTAFKLISYGFFGLIALLITKAVLFPTGYGYSVGYNTTGHFGNGYEHGYTFNYGFTSLVGSMIQIFLAIFIIALIVGIVLLIKNYLFSADEIVKMKQSFSGNQKHRTDNHCSSCGRELNSDWKICPHCGKELINQPDGNS